MEAALLYCMNCLRLDVPIETLICPTCGSVDDLAIDPETEEEEQLVSSAQ